MSNSTTEFYFPWSCSSNSELGKHITTGPTWTPYKYTQHIICTLLTPQPERPKNTLTICICIPCFYITASFILLQISVLCQLRDLNSGQQTNPILCFVMQLIFLTSHMLINFSFKLIKISFTKCFLIDYRQFIKMRYKEWTERESFSAHF